MGAEAILGLHLRGGEQISSPRLGLGRLDFTDSISTASLFGSVAPRWHLLLFDVRFTNVAKIGSEHCEYSGSGPGRHGQPDDH